MKLGLLFASTLALVAPVLARQEFTERSELSSRVCFVGTVVTPGGRPARGALVESSAGGKALAGADGAFELVADVPLDARWVDVTAALQGAQRGSLTASLRVLPATFAAVTSVGTLVVAPGKGNQGRWRSTFGGLPGVDGRILTMTTFDDGHGPALYVGGNFRSAGGIEVGHVARWDGLRWSALGDGFVTAGSETVQSLVVFDDGTGPALYAGGAFLNSGVTQVNHVARWNGASWSSVGGGTNGGAVRALAVFDDGNGPALYATGVFTTAGGVPANSVARWNGASWSALGSGISGGDGRALAVFNAGSGAALYVGGGFTTAGGAPVNRIARWNGASWSALGSGVNQRIYALSVFDYGSGPALYAGGSFSSAGGNPSNCIARWNGASWSSLGAGTNFSVFDVATLDLGGGPALYAGGQFTTAGGVAAPGVARWDGASWAEVGDGAANSFEIDALAAFDRGNGPELHCGGFFSKAGTAAANSIARLDGTHWAELNHGLNGSVNALLSVDLGGTQQLYAGGRFTSMGGVAANYVARWNGSTWSALGSGVSTVIDFPVVNALALYDGAGGEDLYAGGFFHLAGGVAAQSIARWDGAQWSALGAGFNGTVNALMVFDDGSGPALYTGGSSLQAGSSVQISRWNGLSWLTVSQGLNGDVYAFAVFDDGTGPALFAGGAFTSSNAGPMNHVARWTGSGWVAAGSGTAMTVRAFTVFDDGGGPKLYASGDGGSTSPFTRWDGTSWSSVGSGFGPGRDVLALAVLDDGSGPALYAGGTFITADGVAARSIAKWDGANWSPLAAGLSFEGCHALAQLESHGGPALLAGGGFHSSPAGDSYLALWSLGHRDLTTR